MITAFQPTGVLTDGTVIDALTMLQRVADRDIGDELLDWLCKRQPSGDVLAVALRTIPSCSTNLPDRIFAKTEYLRYFSAPSLRRPSGSLTRALLGSPAPAEPPADAPFSPSELFFRELLRGDPLRNAERLVDHREKVDVSRPLAALCDVTFDPQDDAFVRFAVRRLASSDATHGLLTSTLRAIPDFQRRLRPQFEPMLDRLAPTENEDAIARFRKSMEAAVPVARPSGPTTSVLGDLFKMAPVTGPLTSLGLGRTIVSPPPTVRHTIRAKSNGLANFFRFAGGATIIGLAAFTFDGDVAAGTSVGTRLLSRGLSLLAAIILGGAIAFQHVRSTRQVQERRLDGLRVTDPTDALWANVPLAAIFSVYAVFEAHARYVGPVHFWNQAALFVMNGVGLFFFARIFEMD